MVSWLPPLQMAEKGPLVPKSSVAKAVRPCTETLGESFSGRLQLSFAGGEITGPKVTESVKSPEVPAAPSTHRK